MNPLLAKPLPALKPLPPGNIWQVNVSTTGLDEFALGIESFDRKSHSIPWVVVDAAQEYGDIMWRAGKQLNWHEQMHALCCLWARHLIEQEYVDFEPVESSLQKIK